MNWINGTIDWNHLSKPKDARFTTDWPDEHYRYLAHTMKKTRN